MSTVHLTLVSTLHRSQLELTGHDLHSDVALAREALTRIDNTFDLDVPEDASLRIVAADYVDMTGQRCGVAVRSRDPSGEWHTWAREPAGAVAVLDTQGEYSLALQASPEDGATEGAKPTTVTIRLTKGGKPLRL